MSQALKFAQVGGAQQLYVDDVFSTYLYTGNGSTQTINNGIDLAGKGGLVWIKSRSLGTANHALSDTANGVRKWLRSNSTTGILNGDPYGITSFNNNGFSFDPSASGQTNQDFGNTSNTYVSWTFRNADRFFTHTVISHTNGTPTNINLSSLGTVGQVHAKITNTTGDWIVWHRSLTAGNNLRLNTTAAQSTTNAWLSVSGTTATLSGSAPTGTYVIHAWAHDAAADGIIQCGSFTTDGSGNGSYDPGWVDGVQFCVVKGSDTTSNWEIYDTARTSAFSGSDARLNANLSNAEDSVSRVSASGTALSFSGLTASKTYVVIVIRAPAA